MVTINFVVNAQEKENPLKGHYYNCNSIGYVETIITDSLVYAIDTRVGQSISTPYSILNNREFFADDTIEFYILDKHQIAFKTKAGNPFSYNDTLTRFDETIPNSYDYNCDTKMSLTAYDNKLNDEFIERWARYGFDCDVEETVNDDNDGELIVPDLIAFDLPDSLTRKSKYNKVISFTYEEIAIDTNLPYKNKIKQLVYSEDKTKLNLQIYFYFPCHTHYNFFNKIDEEEILKIRSYKGNWLDLDCDNYCKAVLNYEIALKDSKISEIMLNDEVLVLN